MSTYAATVGDRSMPILKFNVTTVWLKFGVPQLSFNLKLSPKHTPEVQKPDNMQLTHMR